MSTNLERDLYQNLHSLLGNMENAFEGIVLSLESESDVVQAIPVQIQPSGETVLCEIAYLFAGKDRGILRQPEVDDRVLVLKLDGNADTCVALAGIYSPAHPMPEAPAGTTVLDPEGITVAKTLGASRQPPVIAPLPADLQAGWDQLKSDMTTLGAILPPVGPTDTVTAAVVSAMLVQINIMAIQMAQFSFKLGQPDAYLSQSMDIE